MTAEGGAGGEATDGMFGQGGFSLAPAGAGGGAAGAVGAANKEKIQEVKGWIREVGRTTLLGPAPRLLLPPSTAVNHPPKPYVLLPRCFVFYTQWRRVCGTLLFRWRACPRGSPSWQGLIIHFLEKRIRDSPVNSPDRCCWLPVCDTRWCTKRYY